MKMRLLLCLHFPRTVDFCDFNAAFVKEAYKGHTCFLFEKCGKIFGVVVKFCCNIRGGKLPVAVGFYPFTGGSYDGGDA